MLLRSILVFICFALEAKSLRLANKDAKQGKLIHVRVNSKDSIDVFGFELKGHTQGSVEIRSIEDWKPVELNLCETKSDNECTRTETANSLVNDEKKRQGWRMSKDYLRSAIPKLLKQVKFDVFHAATDNVYWTNPVYDLGPVADQEIQHTEKYGGEIRFFSSAMMTFLSTGHAVLALTYGDGENADHALREEFMDIRKNIEASLMKDTQKPPLLLYFGNAFARGEKIEFFSTSLFPKQCVMVSTDYWGEDAQKIHATPDVTKVSFARVSEGYAQLNKIPILTTACHASEFASNSVDTKDKDLHDYLLVYGRRRDINSEVLAKLREVSQLPVVILDKGNECPKEEMSKIGVTCLEETGDRVRFHQILQRARLVISELNMQEDNPTMLEALQCGTPVLAHSGRHEFLTKYGEKPHVTLWKYTAELLNVLPEALKATSMGNHKLAPWTPEALKDSVMRDSLKDFVQKTRHDCDNALVH